MSRNHQVIEEEGDSAPAYLVTFSALTTLLMLFFVLLLTMATVQDAGMLDEGRYAETQEAFLQSVRSFGLGAHYGKKQRPDFGNLKTKYSAINPDVQFEDRTIDAKEEDIRRVFKKIARSVTTMPSQIVGKRTNFSVTNIGFSSGDSQLNEPAKKFLTQFALDLQQNSGAEAFKLYVLGLARNEEPEKRQWILSAKRAQAVANFLNDILPSQLKCPVYSWGAGPGGEWVTGDSPISKQSQILIAVLRAND